VPRALLVELNQPASTNSKEITMPEAEPVKIKNVIVHNSDPAGAAPVGWVTADTLWLNTVDGKMYQREGANWVAFPAATTGFSGVRKIGTNYYTFSNGLLVSVTSGPVVLPEPVEIVPEEEVL
jgi:hypothetical protein